MAAGLLALSLAAPAHALYRCGNTFQDKPCVAGVTETPVNPALRLAKSQAAATAAPGTAPGAGAAPARAAGLSFAAVCAQMGVDAQRVVWNREGGATQESQISALAGLGPRGDMVKVIESVYNRRGSAPEIRSAIEAECLVEKQRQADAAAMLRSLNEQAGNSPSATPTTSATPSAPAAPSATGAATADAGAKPQAAGEMSAAADPKTACPGLKSQDESLKSRMRAGGSAGAMEAYQVQRRRLDKALLDARC